MTSTLQTRATRAPVRRRSFVLVGAILLLASYGIAYRYLPFRDGSRFRNAELFVHTRDFHHEWQGELFYPAAYIEWVLIRAYPQPFLPHPSWSEYPQVLLLEAGDHMKLRRVYLVLCLLGFFLPYWQFVPWIAQHGIPLRLFVHDLFANRIGGFFAMDVLVSAIALCVFASAEGRRLGMRNRWLPIVATLLVGVSLGLPLFLYFREVELDRKKA